MPTRRKRDGSVVQTQTSAEHQPELTYFSLHVGAGVASLPAAVHLPGIGFEGALQVRDLEFTAPLVLLFHRDACPPSLAIYQLCPSICDHRG